MYSNITLPCSSVVLKICELEQLYETYFPLLKMGRKFPISIIANRLIGRISCDDTKLDIIIVTVNSVVRCTINHIAEQYGWNKLPSVLKGNTTADLIALGHAEESLCLLEVLYRISLNQSLGNMETAPTGHKSAPSTKDSKPKLSKTDQHEYEALRHSTGASNKSSRHISFGENSTRLIPSAREAKEEQDSSPPPPPPQRPSTSSSWSADTTKAAVGGNSRGEVTHYAEPPPPPPQHKPDPLQHSHNAYDSKNTYVRELSRSVPAAGTSGGSRQSSAATQSGQGIRVSSSLESQRGSSNRSDLDLVFSREKFNDDYSFSSRRSDVEAFGMTSEDRVKLIQWLQNFGIQARPPADRPANASPAGRKALDLEDEWTNGVLLSELAAVCSRGNRCEVKEVGTGPVVRVLSQWPGAPGVPMGLDDPVDGYKRMVVRGSLTGSNKGGNTKPRLMLVGTELAVKSRAQVNYIDDVIYIGING
jgi:hypothetical protein